MGGLEDAGAWGLAWAMLAAAAGLITAAVAATLLARLGGRDFQNEIDFMSGYDAAAPAFFAPRDQRF